MKELVVGSEDYGIRVFQREQTVHEIMEVDVIAALVPLQDKFLGYALANGTVGVYHDTQRVWHVKGKNAIAGLCAYDIDNDGVDELIIGWTSGKVEARNPRSGELVFKDKLPAPVAKLLVYDYQLIGKPQLILVSVAGHVKGFCPANADSKQAMLAAQTTDALRVQIISPLYLSHCISLSAYVSSLL